MVKWSSLQQHVRLTQQLNTPVMMDIGWTMEMPNVPAKLWVLGVVKLLDAVSSVIVYYHYPYSLDRMPLSISRHSQIVAALPEMLNKIVAALE